jgi:DNA adenine methylase
MFDRDQFALIAEAVGAIEGAFVLSINDRPEVRDLFAAFNFREASRKYTVAAGAAKHANELIITNRDVKTGLL